MALGKMTDDVAVHQTLGDEPNAENSLTADDLKRLFDKPAELIKAFINDKLVPFVPDKRGDTMEGDLSMGTHRITDIGAPLNDADAATKKYVDDAKIPQVGAKLSDTEITRLTVKGMFLAEGEDFGDEVPDNLAEDKLFFVKVVDL